MPKLKQPESLEDTAMKFLVNLFGNYLHKDSMEGSSLKIHECVANIKNDICPNMSGKLEADFCFTLIKHFLWFRDRPIHRPEAHIRAVAGIIMDRKISNLKCSYRVLDYLNAEDTLRIFGLGELNFGSGSTRNLTNFHIEDVTKLVYRIHCTDSDLVLIGQECTKLVHLDIDGSETVTDVGLRALRGCVNLQFFAAADCGLTQDGVIEFLSENIRIREFEDGCGFNWFSLPETSVYPSIEWLDPGPNTCLQGSFRFLSERFPNLKSLDVYHNSAKYLEELEYFRKLSYLKLHEYNRLRLIKKMVRSFRFIGERLLRLTLIGVDAKERDMVSIFHCCSNLEYLELSYEAKRVKKSFIPSHQRLKTLKFSDDCKIHAVQFGEMPKLEELMFEEFQMSLNGICRGIVLDHRNLPELKRLTLGRSTTLADIGRIREIVRAENLDLEIARHRDDPAYNV